jgi:ubiquitin carboxyl-terminal hydrolase 7
MERLEERMKGTPVENVLPDLFTEKVKTYISCINVDYETFRIEDFWDIQLNVANNRSLDDSFKDYTRVQNMDRKFQYSPPRGGGQQALQDARGGVIFEKFPPVLHLHLKRYQYDVSCETSRLLRVS